MQLKKQTTQNTAKQTTVIQSPTTLGGQSAIKMGLFYNAPIPHSQIVRFLNCGPCRFRYINTFISGNLLWPVAVPLTALNNERISKSQMTMTRPLFYYRWIGAVTHAHVPSLPSLTRTPSHHTNRLRVHGCSRFRRHV